MSKRILVTGGAGFIGSHIVDALIERGDAVTILDNLSTGRRDYVNPQAHFIAGDVRNPDDVAVAFGDGFDAVLHIAGQASIRLSFQNPADDLNVNTLGTLNVLQQCIVRRVPRLLFASSMTIYGNPAIIPTPEDVPPNPVAYYGITKYAAERYVHLTAQRRDVDFAFNVTSLRMFNVYGPRQSLNNAYQGVLAIFIGHVLRGEPITIHGDGEQSRDFVYIADVVRAWVQAIDVPQTFGQVINIGTGVGCSVNRLCDSVLGAFGTARTEYNVRHSDVQPGDLRQSAADISRAHDLLGWQPEVDLDEGMEHTIRWARGD